MLVTTLERPEGVKVKRLVGLVHASVTGYINPAADLASFISAFRGKEDPLSYYFATWRRDVIEKLKEAAKRGGANAVLGLRIETVGIGMGRFLITAYGTAAEVE